MYLIIVHNEKKALSPTTKDRTGRLKKGGTAAAQYIFCSWGCEGRWFVWVFLHLVFFLLEVKKKPKTVRCGFAYARCDNEFKSLSGERIASWSV